MHAAAGEGDFQHFEKTVHAAGQSCDVFAMNVLRTLPAMLPFGKMNESKRSGLGAKVCMIGGANVKALFLLFLDSSSSSLF